MEIPNLHRYVRRSFKFFKLENKQWEALATIILRVPGYFILDYSYQNDMWNCIPRSTSWPDIVSAGFAIFAVLQGLLVLLLPLRQLVSLYMHYLTIAVLAGSDTFSKYYVDSEKQLMKQWPDYGTVSFQGFSNMLMLQKSLFDDNNDIETLFLRQHVAALVFHTLVAMMVTFFLDLESKKDKILLLVYLVPVLARLAGCPISDLHIAHNFASCFVIFITIQYIFLCMPSASRFVLVQLFKLVFVFNSFSWRELFHRSFHALFVPVQLLLFWLMLFFSQLYSHIDINKYGAAATNENTVAKLILPSSLFDLKSLVSSRSNVFGNGTIEFIGKPKTELIGNMWHLFFVQSAAEVCVTPLMLVGACVTITYLSSQILKWTYYFTAGPTGTRVSDISAFTSGIIMFILAIQTSLLSSPLPHRVALFSIILRIVFTHLIQKMLELVEPVVLGLSSQGMAPISKHIRAGCMLLILLLLPLYLVHSLLTIFDNDIWLLIVASTNLLTSVKTSGLIVIHSLLTWDALSSNSWPERDDVIYYTKASTRICELAIAIFLVVNGSREFFLGHWSLLNACILFSHAYFNVWKKLQMGWRSFLMRREAAAKISSLPLVTKIQLDDYDDVCAICLSNMSVTTACVASCKHIFHCACLKRCLYSRDTCPICHGSIQQPVILFPQNDGGPSQRIEDEVGNNIPLVHDDL